MTSNGEYIIISDGSSTLYIVDDDLNFINTVIVTDDGKQVNEINELEWINGMVINYK